MATEQSNHRRTDDAAFPPELLVALDRASGRGLREQLEGELRRAVRGGRLAIGTTLPPSRILARDLGVARSVVVDAYGQLAAEGYLEARQGSGTRVRATSRTTGGRRLAGPPSRHRPPAARRAAGPGELPARLAAPLPRGDRRAVHLVAPVSGPARQRGAPGGTRRIPGPGPRGRDDARPAPDLRRLHAGARARLPRATGPRGPAPRGRGSVLQLPPRAHRQRRPRTRADPRRPARHRRGRARRRTTTSPVSSSRPRTHSRSAPCSRRSGASRSGSGRERTTR